MIYEVDVSDPSAPVRNSRFGGLKYAEECAADGDYIAATSLMGFWILRLDELSPVLLSSFDVHRQDQGAVIRWEPGQIRPEARFNLFRQIDGDQRIQINAEPLGAYGHSFEFVDPAPHQTAAVYWIEEVAPNGNRTWLGSAELAAGDGHAHGTTMEPMKGGRTSNPKSDFESDDGRIAPCCPSRKGLQCLDLGSDSQRGR